MLDMLPKDHHPAATTALMVYRNTLLEEVAITLEKHIKVDHEGNNSPKS